ncbi:MAG: response regulator [Fibrobacteria bacterium]
MKILLVDDSVAMRQIQKKTLMGLGMTDICEASDGLLAIKAAGTDKPDLIMMDWNMPNMTGIDALKQMKPDPALK